MKLQGFVQKVVDHKNLSSQEASQALQEMMLPETSPVLSAAFLVALTSKGETSEEILGFLQAMRQHMLRIPAPENAIDVCGTGGDGKGTFNISTAVAFVIAGAGVPVVKHGNRAASSKTGSADVLEALGVNIMLTPERAEEVLSKVGMVFLFAPLFHPSMKQVALVRKELKIRTIFNYLGPFANPAGVKYQLIGVPNAKDAEKLLSVAKSLHYKRLALVTSEDGLDEVSISSASQVYILRGEKEEHGVITPEDYGFSQQPLSSLQGGDARENAETVRSVLSGETGPKRDVVLLNAALALQTVGRAQTIEEGIKLAEEAIDAGKAKRILENLQKETGRYA